MSGTVLPRQNLAVPAIDASRVRISNSLIDFLRAELRLYKAAVRKRRSGFTDQKLADEIQFCPALASPPSFSPETLRRFLNNIPQQHGDAFFRVIIVFLLHEKWIAPADLAAHDKDAISRTAVAMQEFFGSAPETMTALFRQLEGTYVRYALAPARIVRISFTLTLRHDPPVLRALEEQVFYATTAAEHVLRETGGLHPDSYRTLHRLLASHAQQEGASRYSAGFGVADANATAFFVRSELTGGGTIYLVNGLSYDQQRNRVETMRSTRYTGTAEGGTEGGFEFFRSNSDLAGPISTVGMSGHGAA